MRRGHGLRAARPFARWLALAGLAGCASRPSGPSPSPLPSSAPAAARRGAAPAPAPDPALDALAARAVYHDDFARAELYTWTSVEQLKKVRASLELLVADSSTGGRASPFNQALIELEAEGSADAEFARLLLEHPSLRRRRYAWPSPFATTMGLGQRRYGDSLIRIELDPRAWIARFEPGAAQRLSFVDMRGEPVARERALAEPERVAAVYHVRGPPELGIAYREYVVCSEAMIRAWSLATPEIRARVDADIELLEQLRGETLAQLPRAAVAEPAAPSWARAGTLAPRSPLALWHAGLAFDNLRYRPGGAHLEAIVAALRGYEDDGGAPLVHRPQANVAACSAEGACRP